MKRHREIAIVTVVALAAFGAAASRASDASTHPAKAMAKTGPFTVKLEVLPAETFRGFAAKMSWDGGARPVKIGGTAAPNHHMVVFVKRDGKPDESASVAVKYRRLGSADASWKTLPVARMHVKGKGRDTTHYGNNVALPAGRYAVMVDVDGNAATLNVTVSS